MPKNPLPKGVRTTDLAYSRGAADKVAWDDRRFELWWVTGFGWVIPTLMIGRGRMGYARRTYAVRVSDGATVRVGMGPHVTEQHVVHVNNASVKRLAAFLDLRRNGGASAGRIRDRISSRRAQGQLMRAEGRRSWRWDV